MGESQEGVQCLGKALLHNQGRKCIPAYVRRILQSNCALDTNVWKQDMELVTKEFEMSQRVSSMGRLAYGRQEANETLRWYLKVPKLHGCS